MKYSIEEVTVRELTELVKNNKIDLNPSYQRNFIWSTNDQSSLIDTMLKGYPLPNFFIYKKSDGQFEMVDGQQRTTTIYNFVNGKVKSTKEFGKITIQDIEDDRIWEYRLPVVYLSDVKNLETLNEFYVLINKKGKHLNIPEMNKADFYNSRFLNLANELLSHQEFIDLNLFTEASSKRMNDRSYVEELLAYLYEGITEKKKIVKSLLENDIDENEYEELKTNFKVVISIIHQMNEYIPLAKTRYKQKSDFYTLFSFVEKYREQQSSELFSYQYKILLLLDRKDEEGRQFIRPSNDECDLLKDYATNCVSQSNSKMARLRRLSIFETVLRNTDFQKNDGFRELLEYLSQIFGEENIDLTNVDGFELINLSLLPDA
ncbi:DUF262 domain-containing protein [Aquimarina sp. M1]